LIDLLRAAINLPSEAIRCTSVPGYKLRVGADTDDELRKEIHESRAFIGLITEASFESAYVLFELGARWGADKQMAPLLAAGTPATILKGPIVGKTALSCDNPHDLHQLVDDIALVLNCSADRPSSYSHKIDALVTASEQARERRSRTATCKSDGAEPDSGIGLSLDEARYLMSLSRPRNQRGIPIGYFDKFATRDSERYQAMLDKFLSLHMMRFGTSTYLLTDGGYAYADELWRVFVLKALRKHQAGEFDYVHTETVATAACLVDGQDELRELSRHLRKLEAFGFLELVPTDGGIAAARLTPEGVAKLRTYSQMDFETVD
jgi:hypothetical protein